MRNFTIGLVVLGVIISIIINNKIQRNLLDFRQTIYQEYNDDVENIMLSNKHILVKNILTSTYDKDKEVKLNKVEYLTKFVYKDSDIFWAVLEGKIGNYIEKHSPYSFDTKNIELRNNWLNL